MTNTSALAEKNRRIKELEDELRRRQEIIDDARIRMDDRLKRAEAAEAEVERLKDDLHIQHECRRQQEQRAEAAEARVEESDETAHLANGTVALALKHRDAAEARVADLEAKLARADRLAEAADDLFPTARADEWGEMREALAAYRSDSPPQGEAVHPDTERLQFLIDQEATITLDRRVPTFVVDWVKAGGSIEEARSSDPREAIDAAREVTGEHDED